MKKYIYPIALLFLAACVEGGTHGYISAYKYQVTKSELEKAIRQVIEDNPIVIQDSVKDYYNDDTNYVTLTILENGLPFSYTFRYYEGPEYWDTSKTSEIFIAYAHDASGKGGSEGNGGVKRSDKKLIKKLTEPFEREFVHKIDSLLGIGHTEE